ncbi:MAG: glycosyltransferase [Aeromicrobium erythreum]
MIGYYAHHRGAGHVHRALAVASALGAGVTGLSTAAAPVGWSGPWIRLDDDADALPDDPTAGGVLHWVPRHHDGLRSRMATIARWLDAARPDLVVVDVSVEVALLCRLHGVPVVVVGQPGLRDDPPHATAYALAEAVVAPWPDDVEDLLTGIDDADPRVHRVGAMSRFDGRPRVPTALDDDPRPVVTVLLGRGGHDLDAGRLAAAREATPGWRWVVVGEDAWVDDPWELLLTSDVVLTHAGQNAVAEVAAARRPAVVVAQDRPHGEQDATAALLRRAGRWPVVSLDDLPDDGWPELLALAGALDGERWSTWNDGLGAQRFADVIRSVARS